MHESEENRENQKKDEKGKRIEHGYLHRNKDKNKQSKITIKRNDNNTFEKKCYKLTSRIYNK